MSSDDLNESQFRDLFFDKAKEYLGDLGHFNLVLFGKTGVGKSTLINAIFGVDVAQTGNGRPVTADLFEHEVDGSPLRLFDTKGFEVGESAEKLIRQMRLIIEERRGRPVSEQVHAVWYCVRAGDRRFEDQQAAFVEELAQLGLPVLLVLTQVGARAKDADLELDPEALALAEDISSRSLPVVPGGRALLTNALANEWKAEPVHGLQELLDATFRVVPEGVKAALTAAQAIDAERKKVQATKLIRLAMAASAAAAAVPIPFAQSAVIVPIQAMMMARVSVIYGHSMTSAVAAGLAARALLSQGVGYAAKAAVRALLEWIPGFGAGAAVVQASVAVTFTWAVGEAWRLVCEALMRDGQSLSDLSDAGTLAEEFLRHFKGLSKQPLPVGVRP